MTDACEENSNGMTEQQGLEQELRRFKRRRLPLEAQLLLPDGREITGTVENISAGGALVKCDAQVEQDTEVAIRLAELGQFRANVRRCEPDAIALEFVYKRERAARLADKLTCMLNENQRGHERREADRTPTRYPSSLTLEDGRTLPCVIVDISTMGAAVAITPTPRVGTRVHLADRRAVVVRTEEGVIGLRFFNPDPSDEA